MIAFRTSFVNLFSEAIRSVFLPVRHLRQAMIRLVDQHKSQRSLDDPPDAEQADPGIQRHQYSNGRHSYFPADETGLQYLPQENTYHIQRTTDKCSTEASLQ